MAIIEYRFFQPSPPVEELTTIEALEEHSAAIEYIPPIILKDITPPGINSSRYELTVTENDEGKVVGEVRKTRLDQGSSASLKLYSDHDVMDIDRSKELFFLDDTATGVPFVSIAEYNPPEEPQLRSMLVYRDDK